MHSGLGADVPVRGRELLLKNYFIFPFHYINSVSVHLTDRKQRFGFTNDFDLSGTMI